MKEAISVKGLNTSPLVSVIIPAYNNRDFLKYVSIPSVLAQAYSAWELIVVDDGSTDGTKSVVDGFAREDRRVRYICKENGGCGSARNVGIRSAEGKYVLCLDADDIFVPTTIEKMVSIAERENCDVIICSSWVVTMPDGHFVDYYFGVRPQGSLFKKDIFYRYAFFNEALPYAEDGEFELALRVKAREIGAIKKIVVEEPLTVYFKRTSGQMTDPKNYQKVQQSLLATIKKFEAYVDDERDFFSGTYFMIGHFEAEAENGRLVTARKYFKMSWDSKPSVRTAIFYVASFLGRSFYKAMFNGANWVRKHMVWAIRIKKIEKKFRAAYATATAQVLVIEKTGVFGKKC
jgi:glycosyltransferase involved in cell wall biosynthesis